MRRFVLASIASIALLGASRGSFAPIVPSRVDLEGLVKKIERHGGMGMERPYEGTLEQDGVVYEFLGFGTHQYKLFRDAYKKEERVSVQCSDKEVVNPCRVYAVKKADKE